MVLHVQGKRDTEPAIDSTRTLLLDGQVHLFADMRSSYPSYALELRIVVDGSNQKKVGWSWDSATLACNKE
jgi:hypothetical protein